MGTKPTFKQIMDDGTVAAVEYDGHFYIQPKLRSRYDKLIWGVDEETHEGGCVRLALTFFEGGLCGG